MRCYRVGVVAQRADANIDTWILVFLLLQLGYLLLTEVRHEYLWSVWGISSVLLAVGHVLHTYLKRVTRYMQCATQPECIKGLLLHFPHNHGHLINGLIGHQQFAIAVINESARGIDSLA